MYSLGSGSHLDEHPPTRSILMSVLCRIRSTAKVLLLLRDGERLLCGTRTASG